MAQNMKRGRNQRRRSNTNVNRALDSTGPDVKIRGTALQIHDKYQALARDAASAGDRIRAESLLQHAEHYYRLLKSMQPPQQQPAQSDPAEEPQPDVRNETSSEKAAGSEDASDEKKDSAEVPQADATAASEEAEKPKRTRRRRPPRKAAEEADESAGEAETEKEVAEVAAE